MEKFTVHTGQAAPLRAGDVDTDQIIPVRFLTRLTKSGYGRDLFADWREDPEFVLNVEPYSSATILVAGPNFGTGSSREGAVYALTDYGFRAVIAPRFGDIFAGNAHQNGLLPVVVPIQVVERLWHLLESDPAAPITVDLVEQRVRAEGVDEPFPVDPDVRHRLLEGLDDIGLTLQHTDDIATYETTRRPALPTTTRH
ncbi:3-isopropylmalate dehydratase small subunit [Saccharopolyspora sp. TS4A08]|uniref:3-isopropylmalate dehydratase small subunit n=1 Tax=Saccharopolyspora ipomoeae TaxID=3042027 RepID=A0ABT6PQ48_9PSEU|nr:3-isopropylmalate dehydratase small subunit [Saccharopolyspora sp. TS4A08]MDI2030139.1 3-isopropylmalate dehydratase small subunit [Saccharopolyspora sp. TS4A08]